MNGTKILILAGNDQYHPLEVLADMTEGWLRDEKFEDITLSKDRAVITEILSQYDLLILAMTPSNLSPEEEKALVSFVGDGKKIMAIHSATVVSEENTDYIDMIGGRFIHHSHHHEFKVKVADPGHPILAGIDDFEITDELYVLDRTPPASTVLLTAFWEDHAQPILYIKAHGAGKVLYNALGHGPKAYENPNLKKLIIQGAKWLLQ